MVKKTEKSMMASKPRKIIVLLGGATMMIMAICMTWALVRWRVQCNMLERLMWLETVHGWMDADYEYARSEVENAIDGHYTALEYYLQRPLRLRGSTPDSLVDEPPPVTFLQSTRSKRWLPQLQRKHRAFLQEIGSDSATTSSVITEAGPVRE